MASSNLTVSNESLHKLVENLADINLFEGYSDSLLQFAYGSCVLFILVGVPGNFITIMALAMCEKFRNAIAYFIISLHLNNLVYCCMILPITAAIFSTKHWNFGVTMCSVYPFIKYALVGTAHFTVVAITVNRYIIICHPHIYHRLYKRSILIATLLFTWIAPVVMFLPTYFGMWGKFDLDTKGGSCTIVPDDNNRSSKTFFICFAFVGPYLTIVICYARIWWIVRKAMKKATHTRNVLPTSNSERSDSSVVNIETSHHEFSTIENSRNESDTILIDSAASASNCQESDVIEKSLTFSIRKKNKKLCLPSKKDKKLATMIVAILVAFMLCHLPLMLTRLLYGDYKSDPKINVFAHLLEYSTAFVSPLIYVMMSREYRQVYGILFKEIKRKVLIRST